MADLEILTGRYGAKGAYLSIIRDALPDLPIPPFSCIGVDEDWRPRLAEIERFRAPFLRSSSPHEDQLGHSFAGLFASVHYDGPDCFAWVQKSTQNEDTLRYARIHGVPTPLKMGFVVQEHTKARWNWGMLRHPHRPNLLFVQGRPTNDRFRYSENLVYDATTKEFYDIHKFERTQKNPERTLHPEQPESGLAEAIEAFERIERIAQFDSGIAYHMEFGTQPLAIYQWRPFRKKERPAWSVDSIRFARDDGSWIDIVQPTVFGTTPPEGLALTTVRIPVWRDLLNAQDSRIWSMLQTEPPADVIDKVAERLHLNAPERIYAENAVHAISTGKPGIEGFANATQSLRASADPDTTLLVYENLHSYHGPAPDLFFPNARVLLGCGGQEFISHQWFRTAQSFPVAIMGGNNYGKTGDQVHVFSDGRKAIVFTKLS